MSSGAIEVAWASSSRLAAIRYAPEAMLTAKEGAALIEALTRWAAADTGPFAILADAKGVRGADASYRADTTRFYREHRHRLSIAIFNIGPLIRVMTELFRIGSGVQVKTFSNEVDARAWLREKGIAA